MKPEELFELSFGIKAGDMYVILNKEGTSLARDPGLNRPWVTKNKKYADDMADKTGGVAVTIKEAITTLHKSLSKQMAAAGIPPSEIADLPSLIRRSIVLRQGSN